MFRREMVHSGAYLGHRLSQRGGGGRAGVNTPWICAPSNTNTISAYGTSLENAGENHLRIKYSKEEVVDEDSNVAE